MLRSQFADLYEVSKGQAQIAKVARETALPTEPSLAANDNTPLNQVMYKGSPLVWVCKRNLSSSLGSPQADVSEVATRVPVYTSSAEGSSSFLEAPGMSLSGTNEPLSGVWPSGVKCWPLTRGRVAFAMTRPDCRLSLDYSATTT